MFFFLNLKFDLFQFFNMNISLSVKHMDGLQEEVTHQKASYEYMEQAEKCDKQTQRMHKCQYCCKEI